MNDKYYTDQLENILGDFELLKRKSRYEDFSDIEELEELVTLITRSKATIARITGENSEYYKDVETVLCKPHLGDGHKLRHVIGVISALKHDLENDYLKSVHEIIHSDIFSDYLEMSDYLIQEGYKDPAAVIAGSTLESHLRELCKKHSVPTDLQNAKGQTIPKKADLINADLAKASVYTLINQKQITAWLDLRNKAAHGKYTEYDLPEVRLMIAGIKNFISSNPA